MRFIVTTAALGLIAAGCSSLSKKRAFDDEPPRPFIRVASADSNLVQLQIAARKFIPVRGNGAAIWLVGASHIGDKDYYQALQQMLDRQTLVLFEGVGGGEMKERNGKARGGEKPAGRRQSELSSLQTTMAESLGLVFQLDAVDYNRPNFRNSDLTVQELRDAMASIANEQGGGSDLDQLLQLMEGGSVFSSLLEFGLRFIGSNPKLRATAKLMLIEVLGQFNGDVTRLQGLPPSMRRLLRVLVQNRNQKVLADLQTGLARTARGETIAIFYGTAHMDDLERRLLKELHYRPAEDVWFTAFGVDLAAAGLAPEQWLAIRGFARWQMEHVRETKPSAR